LKKNKKEGLTKSLFRVIIQSIQEKRKEVNEMKKRISMNEWTYIGKYNPAAKWLRPLCSSL
jgi:hypothetical protein